jgi:hypothetical protein
MPVNHAIAEQKQQQSQQQEPRTHATGHCFSRGEGSASPGQTQAWPKVQATADNYRLSPKSSLPNHFLQLQTLERPTFLLFCKRKATDGAANAQMQAPLPQAQVDDGQKL